MIGPVPAAIEAPEKKGETVLLPQAGWQWRPSFIVLEAVQPRLTLQKVKHGFKTSKDKGEADKEGRR